MPHNSRILINEIADDEIQISFDDRTETLTFKELSWLYSQIEPVVIIRQNEDNRIIYDDERKNVR